MRMILKYILVITVALMSRAEANSIVLQEFHGAKGKFEFRAEIDVVSKTPNWAAGTESLPLKVEDSIKFALDFLRLRHSEIKEFSVRTVTLNSISTPQIGEKWYYYIFITPVIDGVPQFIDSFDVVVLMNGTVIQKTKVK